MQSKRIYIIVCWWIFLLNTSCCSLGNNLLIDNKNIPKYGGDTLDWIPPNLFKKSNEQIRDEIYQLLINSPDLYEPFVNHSIIFNLYCDTIDCSIQNIEVEHDYGYNEISSKLIAYFKTLDPIINCKHQYKDVKVSHFELLVWAEESRLVFTWGYGYRVE